MYDLLESYSNCRLVRLVWMNDCLYSSRAEHKHARSFSVQGGLLLRLRLLLCLRLRRPCRSDQDRERSVVDYAEHCVADFVANCVEDCGEHYIPPQRFLVRRHFGKRRDAQK